LDFPVYVYLLRSK